MEPNATLKVFTEYAFTQGVLGFTTMLFLCMFLLSEWKRSRDRKKYDSDVAAMRKEFEALGEKRISEYYKIIDTIADWTATTKIQFAVQAKEKA